MINGLFSEINVFRTQNGAPALRYDALGSKVAEMRAVQFSQYMATHTPGTPGFNPHEGYDTTAASVGYDIVSENLAYMTSDPRYVVWGVWAPSGLHRAAMLATDANVMGVSCVFTNGTPYWTYTPGFAQSAPAPGSGAPTLDSEQWAFLSLINAYRAQNGLAPLTVSVALQNASQWMSQDLAANNNTSHTDSLGRSVGARLAAFGYTYTPWGENIAGGYPDAQNTFNQWKGSPGHNANMLNPGFVAIGIGRAYGANSNYSWYWTTDFGGYLDAAITPGTPPPGGGAAPVVNSLTATPTAVSAGQPVTLSWNVSGASSVAIDNGLGAVAASGATTVTPPQTTTYQLTATNSGGTTTARVTVVVNTSPTDTLPPTIPALTSAIVRSQSQIELTWTGSTDNVGVTGYQIVRNGSVVTSVNATARFWSDTSVSAGNIYSYAVRAFDAAGNFSGNSNTMTATIAAAPVPSECPPPTRNAFTGCYYNAVDLTGRVAYMRTDTQIGFDWGSGSPNATVTPSNFSARWQGYFQFEQAEYTFTITASDGFRLYIDGVLVYDRWRDQPAYGYFFRRNLTAGEHLLTAEYYERTGSASAHLTWQRTGAATGANPQVPTISSFVATPAALAAGQSATLTWAVSGATAVSIDNGIGDVTGATSKPVTPPQTTTYRLTASNSAGSTTALVTVTVASASADTQPPTVPDLTSAVVNASGQVQLQWSGSTDNAGVAGYQIFRNGSALGTTGSSARSWIDIAVAAGSTYSYALKSYDAAGNYSGLSASRQVTVPTGGSQACPAAATNAFTGCYYNNTELEGMPAVVRTDAAIAFDWPSGSPSSAVTPFHFSARWEGLFTFEQGEYIFTAIYSDGLKLYVDGQLVLDRWRDQPAYMFSIRRNLTAGQHLIRVEYYERTGSPTAHLTWRKSQP